MVTIGTQEWHVTAVVVAGGGGLRMGGDTPKQYLALGDAPIIAWTLDAFQRAPCVDEITLVVPETDCAMVADDIVAAFELPAVRRTVAGGTTRQESTAAGIAALGGEAVVALVHDGVRPFVSPHTIDCAAETAARGGAALVAIPVVDTMKRVAPDGLVLETVPRESLFAAQTPQAFRLGVLREALDTARRDGLEGTDESMLVERIGQPVTVVPGDAANFKITTPADLDRAREMAVRRAGPRRRER